MYHRRGELFTDQCVYESDRFGGGSFIVWAGFFPDGRTQLKIVQGTLNVVNYRYDILDPIVLPFLQQRNVYHVFQHDNARCHAARLCQVFLKQNHIRVLRWPALSPDLSPIEYVCDELGRRFRHVKIHRKQYRSCVTHMCTSGTTSHKHLSNDCVGYAKLSFLQEVVTHVTELRKPPCCMPISVCPCFVLIMMLRNVVDVALFAMPI